MREDIAPQLVKKTRQLRRWNLTHIRRRFSTFHKETTTGCLLGSSKVITPEKLSAILDERKANALEAGQSPIPEDKLLAMYSEEYDNPPRDDTKQRKPGTALFYYIDLVQQTVEGREAPALRLRDIASKTFVEFQNII